MMSLTDHIYGYLVFESFQFSYDGCTIRPMTQFRPYQTISLIALCFQVILSITKRCCKMIGLSSEISIYIYFRNRLPGSYPYLPSIHYLIIIFLYTHIIISLYDILRFSFQSMHFLQKFFRSFILRLFEYLFGCAVFYNHTFIHEDNTI